MVWVVDVMGWWAGGDGMAKWVWGREDDGLFDCLTKVKLFDPGFIITGYVVGFFGDGARQRNGLGSMDWTWVLVWSSIYLGPVWFMISQGPILQFTES